MARGCTGSDSEEERHDRFRSERNSGSLNASKSLFSTGLQQSSKSRSPLRHLNSPPPRRDRRSPSERSRSRSKRRSKERKKSKERRISKEKLKRNIESNNERGTSKTNETRHSDDSSTRRSESRRRSRSKGRRRSGSKEKKRKSKEIRKKHLESEKNDTFLERFERRRPSVESEIVDSTIIYRDSSPEHDIQSNSKKIHESKLHKKKKEKKKTVDTEEGELISEEENNCFGPALPPKLESEEEDGEVKYNCGPSEGPALPPNFKKDNTTIGPTLPERLCSNKRSNNQEEGPNKIQRLSDAEEEIKEVQRAPLIGPVLPPRETLPSIGHKDEALYGPALPPPQSSEQPAVEDKELETETPMEVDDDLMIGPLPKGMELDDRVQRILEERAQSLRKQLENKNSGAGNEGEKKVREDWMVELPDVKSGAAHLGLGPRKFKTRDGPDMSDRSSWTDIAGVKQKQDKKEDSNKEETRRLEIAAKNAEMERKVKETSSNREKSLLDMHQKELKKKKKKELESKGGKEERRPFSREIDLQANRFDEARTKSVINKAQFLNSRFAAGESKYL